MIPRFIATQVARRIQPPDSAALTSNISGPNNTANGAYALANNTTGEDNTATGFNALFSNTIGNYNTANGSQALYSNTTRHTTTWPVRFASALVNNTHGGENTALGQWRRKTGVTHGLGARGQLSSCITGQVSLARTLDHTTWIGNVYGGTTQSGTTAPVVVSDAGQLGTVASSERFKKDIATMAKTSQAILSLRPVTFHYKTDTKGTPQFGLIAEEVAKVNPALVLPDKEGKPYTVRYDAVNAMLLNEFLKEHRKNEQQESKLEEQEAKIARQEKQIEALTAGLQKVSAQLELNKPAARTVLNDR